MEPKASEKDPVSAYAEVRWLRLHVQRGFLTPRRIVGDEAKGTDTDLAAKHHLTARNHVG